MWFNFGGSFLQKMFVSPFFSTFFFSLYFIFYFVCLRILSKKPCIRGSIKRITACTTVSISAEAISMKCFMVQITIFMRIMGGDGGGDDNTHKLAHIPVDFYYIILMQSHSGCFHTYNHKKYDGKQPKNPS